MKTDFILHAVEIIQQAILASESELESLDREIGDGDHFINMKRGAAAIVDMRSELEPLTPDAVLQKIGMKLLSTIGGASGPLLASFFISMAKSVKESDTDSFQGIAAAFAAGVEAIKHRGKADIGEKTMLDVLIPVARKFSEMAATGAPAAAIFEALKNTAEAGMLSTKEMIATKGRAAFLSERAIGHIDPGAKSCQVMVAAVCDLAASNNVS